MGNQCDARLTDGIIAATLRGRDKDNVGISRQHHLRIEVALHTYLYDASVLHPLQYVVVKEVLRTCQSLHHIVCIQYRKVRELQRCHADGILNGNAYLGVAIGNSSIVSSYQCKVIVFAHIHQSRPSAVLHRVARGIFWHYRNVCLRLTSCSRFPLITARITHDYTNDNRVKS